MFHKIKSVSALPEYKLSVEFCEGVHTAKQVFLRHKTNHADTILPRKVSA